MYPRQACVVHKTYFSPCSMTLLYEKFSDTSGYFSLISTYILSECWGFLPHFSSFFCSYFYLYPIYVSILIHSCGQGNINVLQKKMGSTIMPSKTKIGTRRSVQEFKALDALAGDLGSVPCIHIRISKPSVTPYFQGSDAPFWPSWASGTRRVYIYLGKSSYTENKNK